MPRLLTLSGVLALAAALVACGPSATTTAPVAGKNCDTPVVAHTSPAMVKAVQAAYRAAKSKFKPAEVEITVHTASCRGADPAQPPVDQVLQTDAVFKVPLDDLAAPLQISYAAADAVSALEAVAPGLPGDITLTLASPGQPDLTLRFTRDQGRAIDRTDEIGVMRLAALGYSPAARSNGQCVEIWGKQRLDSLARQTQAAVDKAGLAATLASVSINGTWCDTRFTNRQTEFHIALKVPAGSGRARNDALGDDAAQAIRILSAIPRTEMPGDLPPRLVLSVGQWDSGENIITTLDNAVARVDSGLTGAALYASLQGK